MTNLVLSSEAQALSSFLPCSSQIQQQYMLLPALDQLVRIQIRTLMIVANIQCSFSSVPVIVLTALHALTSLFLTKTL